MRKTLFVMLILSIILPTAIFSAAEKTVKEPTIKELLDKELFEYRRGDRPGGAVLVVKDKEILLNEAFGAAVMEHQVAVTTKTVFDVVNIALPFTAMAVYMLEKENKLALSDTLAKHIPDLPKWAETVTLQHLLDHTSGIMDWEKAMKICGFRQGDIINFRHIMNLVKRQKKLLHEPGAKFTPALTNYNLLAEVVKRVSGQSYRDWVWENIFRPLRMLRSVIRDRYGEPVENQALPYVYSTNLGYRRGADNIEAPGSGGLFTSSDDLAKFLINLSDGKVGGKDVIQKIFTSGKTSDGKATPFATIFQAGTFKGLKRLYAYSYMDGYNSAWFYFPEQKLSVVLICNWISGWVTPYYTGQKISEIFLKDAIKTPKPPPTKAVAAAQKKPEPKTVAIDPAIIDRYTGEFKYRGRSIFFFKEKDHLHIKFSSGGTKYKLMPLSETLFTLGYANFNVQFLKNKEGKYDSYTLRGQTYSRLNRIKPTPAELKEYMGKYYCEVLNTHYIITVKENQLEMSHDRLKPVNLQPEIRDRFTTDSGLFTNVQFQRDGQKKVSGFKLAGVSAVFVKD